MDLTELLESTADGAFAVDMTLKIVYWNQAAQDMLGFAKSETIGHPCYAVLQGLDEGHRRYCKALCPVAQSVSSRKPVASYDIQVVTKEGQRRWLNMSIVTYREIHEEGNAYILHLFRDITTNKYIEEMFNKVLEAARNNNDPKPVAHALRDPGPPLDKLTAREREVLAQLTKGLGTREIAQTLVISPNTVRNHIQKILQKLHVHRRAEAVARAIRLGLVE